MNTETLLSKLQFDSETETALRKKLQRDRSRLSNLCAEAYNSESFDFPLCRKRPLTRLSVIVCLLQKCYDAYHTLGTPEEIIWATFDDVALRARLYRETHTTPGISRNDVIWFRHIMQTNIFKIGVLQFQPFEMLYLDEETIGEPYMTFSDEQKQALPAGTPVLNCHIQKGADLTPAFVEDSFWHARQFFRMIHPQKTYAAFLCYSWLLYPPMQSLLSKDSRILSFAEKFKILSSCEDNDQAWENLLPNTSLFTALQKDPTKAGYACGIRPI